MRLNNYISMTGICSRRVADEYIKANRVKVNGALAVLGMQINESDEVRLDNELLKLKVTSVTLAYHKPIGIICTTDISIEDNIIEAINYPERIFPIGRLDRDSEGLILLTNDGSLVNRILRSENQHTKEYLVSVDQAITSVFIKQMSEGVRIFNPVQKCMTLTLPAIVNLINPTTFSIQLTQGLNRQIRRMVSVCDYKVTHLKRIRVMNIELGDLPCGQWRILTETEMDVLNQQLEK
ncbi:MAG: pseudouridine synthase [Erysipelotrichaceae bacterium]